MAFLVYQFNANIEGEEESECYGLSKGPSGLIVTDYRNSAVKIFDVQNFEFQFQLEQYMNGYQMFRPVDVVYHQFLNKIYVTDWGHHGLVEFDPLDGGFINHYPEVYLDDGYVTASRSGLVVADTLREQLLLTDDKCIAYGNVRAEDLSENQFAPRYLCPRQRLLNPEWNPTWNSGPLYVSQWIPSPRVTWTHYHQEVDYVDNLGLPYGVCSDENNILVADRSNHQVLLFHKVENRSFVVTSDVRDPTAVCIFDQSRVAVLQCDGEVKIFDYQRIQARAKKYCRMM